MESLQLLNLILVLVRTTAVLSYQESNCSQPTIVSTSTTRPTEFDTDRLELLESKITQLEQNLEKFCSRRSIPESCNQIQSRTSGIYLIQPQFALKPFLVLCDMETKGGGWTYFLNRFDGSINFTTNWTDYKQGFGKLTGEFWLGLDYLNQLTGYKANELLVELTDWDEVTAYAHYDAFIVGNEEEGYPLKLLGKYSGDAGDSLRYHERMKFTTLDKDNDLRSWNNCAKQEKGGFWYNDCTEVNPTGRYLKGNVSSADEWQILYWTGFRGTKYSLKRVRMMVK